jgi:putative flippase GtrA
MLQIFSRSWKKLSSTQFFRFAVIGSLNTVLDFLIVNFLAFIFGVYQGINIIVINTTSFIIVVTVSFLLNKKWTFNDRRGGLKTKKQYIFFFTITFVGLIINNSIVYLLTTIIGPQFGFSIFIWLNFSKAVAIAIALFWNFFNYKYLIFKSEKRINNE